MAKTKNIKEPKTKVKNTVNHHKCSARTKQGEFNR